ncbi:uncharacterized protein LOC117898046 [Drosophila subobscura]|uniref:uncharacterized protein LOC117898046 n=1 Tax=Drosophila subobscura TaxID=7241 RepID=UPI00155ADBDF|nr:uncharacterized protein LOC117898046 [Drosophila subobscura]
MTLMTVLFTMKTHLVLAVGLCCFSLSSLAEGQEVSSLSMTPFAIAIRLLDPRHLLCFHLWLAKLVTKAPVLTIELFACTKGSAAMTFRLPESLKQMVTMAAPIVSACASIVSNAAIGGLNCVREVAARGLDLVAVMKRFHQALIGIPLQAAQCVKESFQKFFGVSNLFEVIDGCLFPKK